MWDKRELCDLRLVPQGHVVGDTCISVHSAVIASASEAIRKILVQCQQQNGAMPPELVVHVEPDALEELVRFFYTGEIRICDQSVASIMQAADTLGVQVVLDLCVDYLRRHISAANALTVSDLAVRFDRPELKNTVEGFLLDTISNLVQEADFLQQPIERVQELLGDDNANFSNEMEVFRAVVRWVRHDLKNRGASFATLLSDTVRLPLMTSEQLCDEVETEELVRQDPEAQNIVMKVYRYQALPPGRRSTSDIRGTKMRRQQNAAQWEPTNGHQHPQW